MCRVWIQVTHTPSLVARGPLPGHQKDVRRAGTDSVVFLSLFKDVNEDPGEDVALLSVSFEDTEATQVYPKLYLSPRIEQ